MNTASPQEIKEYCLAAKGNGADQLTVPLSDLFPLLAQLEALQERNASLQEQIQKLANTQGYTVEGEHD